MWTGQFSSEFLQTWWCHMHVTINLQITGQYLFSGELLASRSAMRTGKFSGHFMQTWWGHTCDNQFSPASDNSPVNVWICHVDRTIQRWISANVVMLYACDNQFTNYRTIQQCTFWPLALACAQDNSAVNFCKWSDVMWQPIYKLQLFPKSACALPKMVPTIIPHFQILK